MVDGPHEPHFFFDLVAPIFHEVGVVANAPTDRLSDQSIRFLEFGLKIGGEIACDFEQWCDAIAYGCSDRVDLLDVNIATAFNQIFARAIYRLRYCGRKARHINYLDPAVCTQAAPNCARTRSASAEHVTSQAYGADARHHLPAIANGEVYPSVATVQTSGYVVLAAMRQSGQPKASGIEELAHPFLLQVAIDAGAGQRIAV